MTTDPTAPCRCGCPTDLHIGDIGCPCGPPDEPPCVTALEARTGYGPGGDAPLYAATAASHGDVLSVRRAS